MRNCPSPPPLSHRLSYGSWVRNSPGRVRKDRLTKSDIDHVLLSRVDADASQACHTRELYSDVIPVMGELVTIYAHSTYTYYPKSRPHGTSFCTPPASPRYIKDEITVALCSQDQ